MRYGRYGSESDHFLSTEALATAPVAATIQRDHRSRTQTANVGPMTNIGFRLSGRDFTQAPTPDFDEDSKRKAAAYLTFFAGHGSGLLV
jgi:hypothetical protein